MKQPFASAARLRGGGPILTNGSMTMFWLGSPPPRIVIGQLGRASPAVQRRKGMLVQFVSGADQSAGRSTTPLGTLPLVTMRQSAMSSLRASATIIFVLRAPLGPSVLLRNHRVSALSF